MAEEPGKEGTPAPPKQPAAPEDDGFVAKLRKVLPDLLDEILGKEEEGAPAKPAAPSGPKTDRQVEQSLRDQVASAMRDLEQERSHAKDHEAIHQPGPVLPPQPEVKPWRNKFWGE